MAYLSEKHTGKTASRNGRQRVYGTQGQNCCDARLTRDSAEKEMEGSKRGVKPEEPEKEEKTQSSPWTLISPLLFSSLLFSPLFISPLLSSSLFSWLRFSVSGSSPSLHFLLRWIASHHCCSFVCEFHSTLHPLSFIPRSSLPLSFIQDESHPSISWRRIQQLLYLLLFTVTCDSRISE